MLLPPKRENLTPQKFISYGIPVGVVLLMCMSIATSSGKMISMHNEIVRDAHSRSRQWMYSSCRVIDERSRVWLDTQSDKDKLNDWTNDGTSENEWNQQIDKELRDIP